MVRQVLDSIFVRGCIALPQACASLDDEAAEAIRARLDETQSAVGLLQDEEMRALWSETLRQVVNLNGLHGLVEGGGSRLLFDGGDMDAEELGMRLSRASSYGAVPMHTAAWIEGLLGTSGSLLIHEDRLWSILDEWLAGLTAEQFIETLPLLRRTFSRFSAPERRQLGERAAGGAGPREVSSDLDQERAARPLPLLRAILGIPEEVAF
jgi:hypothetical protein